MDIIITTPKSQMANAAQEAAECIADGGGDYFRRFNPPGPRVMPGDKVFYVEDGFIRGYATATRLVNIPRTMRCDTTGRWYAPGYYVFMRADSWKWIKPIPMRGFMGFRYARARGDNPNIIEHVGACGASWVEVVGDWLDPKPPAGPGQCAMQTCDRKG